MPRSARKESGVGIYHVMMRGINRQAIFDDDEDCRRFVHILADLPFQHDDDGMLLPTRTCVIYAWCLMSNHFHLLVMEKDWKIAEVIKSLASSYVYYYNKKNERIGHLFQERFKSEPCNDMEYFTTCEKISIDFAVMEPAAADGKVFTHSADFGWSDLGNWASLHDKLAKDANGNGVVGNVKLYECSNCVVHAEDVRKIVLQGLDGYIVSEKNGQILVCKRSEEQRIRDFSAD